MKVLHIIPSMGPARGGPSRSSLDMCKALAQSGLEVTLATTDDDGRGRLDVPLGQPVHHDGFVTWYFRRHARPYTFSPALLRWVDHNVDGFDLVHLHAVFSHVSDWTPAILAHHGKPYGVTPHGILGTWGMRQRHPLAKQILYRALVGPYLQRAAFVHFTTGSEREQAVAWGALPRSVVFPYGLALRLRGESARSQARRGPLTLLALSRIDPKKQFELCFQAMARLQAQGCPTRLIVAGEGDPAYTRSLQDLASRLGIAGSIEWPGFVQDQDKERLWDSADVFVLPSRSENFGVAVVEAMAAGLPVVISDQVGIHDVVQQAGAGLVVPCEAEALAGALSRLAGDAGLCRQLAANGQALVRDRFSLPAIGRRLAAVYEQALQGTGGDPRAE